MYSRSKHISILLITSFLSILSCTSFQEEELPMVFGTDVSELSFISGSCVRALTVTSGTRWDVSNMPAWISLQSITKSIGSPYEWVVNFVADANDEYNREGEISIKNQSETIQISVYQTGKKGKYIPVESVSVAPTELSLTEGESSSLSFDILPANASVKEVSWKSSTTSIATVSETGEVNALAPGTAQITVTSEDGGKTASCEVTVKAKVIPVSSVSLNKTSLTMTVGDTETLVASVLPENATDPSVAWSSSNTSIATVSSTGEISAKAAGTATITVKTNDGGKTATCTINVTAATVSVTGVSLNKTSMSMTVGDTQTLTATITPSNATDKSVTWSSNNTSVATVSSSGVVTAKAAGMATITVKTTDGSKTATCTVTVKAATVSVTGVSLDNTSITMTEGTTQTLTATVAPENATDKSVTWSSNNISVATVSSSGVVTAKAAGTATITVKTNDSGKTATCTVTVKAATISVTGISLDKTSLSLTVGDTQTLTATITPSNATDKSVTWSSNNTSVATVSSTGVVTVNNVGLAVITVATNDGNLTASCSVIGYAIPDIVDLGIGVKWGSFNLGAVKPEDSGYYYPWGYTEPEAFSHNDFIFFSLELYKWYNISDRTLSKYCTVSSYGSNGFTDNKTVLDNEDDAAYVNLGTEWRIPTKEECTRLIDNCSWEWSVRNGINGYKVTGPNGNSIFLPVAGYGNTTQFNDYGSRGYIWSSSLKTDYPYSANMLRFGSSSIECSALIRDLLLPIRPVYGESSIISVTGVSLDKTSLTLTAGDTQTLTATVSPSTATDKSVTWSSSNTSVATVSSSGVVTAKAAGSATITVKTNDGGKTATCSVTVNAATVSVTGVSLDKTSLSMSVGDTQTLTATVSPSNATDKSVTWSSNNTSVATVSSSGVVTAKAAGTATITVTTNDGGKTTTCTVTVSAMTDTDLGYTLDDVIGSYTCNNYYYVNSNGWTQATMTMTVEESDDPLNGDIMITSLCPEVIDNYGTNTFVGALYGYFNTATGEISIPAGQELAYNVNNDITWTVATYYGGDLALLLTEPGHILNEGNYAFYAGDYGKQCWTNTNTEFIRTSSSVSANKVQRAVSSDVVTMTKNVAGPATYSTPLSK